MDSIEDIAEDYERGVYTADCYPNKNAVKKDHVFDEEKSVRWNREQAVTHNNNRRVGIQEYKKKTIELNKKMFLKLKESLMCSYPNMSGEQIDNVLHYAYVEKHSYMVDFFNSIEELCELF